MTETEFWCDYKFIRDEVYKATESFYTYLSIHAVASENLEIHKAMNRNPTFWNIQLYALQTTFFITMGRIFDDGKDAHSMHKLVSSALAHPEFFSKQALAKRKSGGQNEPGWLEDYLRNVFEPGVADLRRIKRQLAPFRTKFDFTCRGIRDAVFAHTLVKDGESVSEMFGKIQISEIEEILYVLQDTLEALWQLYHNGRRLKFGQASKSYKDRIESTTRAVLLELAPSLNT